MTKSEWQTKKRRKEIEDQLHKFHDIISALSRNVENCMGRVNINQSSEGSLHQHIKIKHPEIYTGET